MAHPAYFTRDRGNRNMAELNHPLENMKFSEWWWHGNLNYPPPAGVLLDIPANGKMATALTSNLNRVGTEYGGRGWSTYVSNPRDVPRDINHISGLSGSTHNFHIRRHGGAGGCALAIAYKDDQYAVTPEDFVIFSVAHDCPTRQLQDHEVPNLPACNTPSGTCMCAWFWVHLSEAGSDQNYMTPFKCRVTGARSNAAAVDVGNAVPPRMCHDPANCHFGPRLPMYWHNERDNMPEPSNGNPWSTPGSSNNAPFYGPTYGFREGAQHDIFVNTNPYRQRTRKNPRPSSSMIVSGSSKDRLTRGGDATLTSPNGRYTLSIINGCRVQIRDTRDNNREIYVTPINSQLSGTCTLRVGNDGRVGTYAGNTLTWETPFTMPSRVPWSNAGVSPFTVEVTNSGQMLVRDGWGQNRWESLFRDRRQWVNYDSRNPDESGFPPQGFIAA